MELWLVGIDGSKTWSLVGCYGWIIDMELGLVGMDGHRYRPRVGRYELIKDMKLGWLLCACGLAILVVVI